MGITKLWSYVHENLDEKAYKKCRIEDFKDKTLLFDTKGLIYRVKFGNKGVASYLRIFISIVEECLKNNIIPIFIMDGLPPKSKLFVNLKRKEQRLKTEEDIKDAQEWLKKKKKDLDLPIEFTAQEVLDSGLEISEENIESLMTMEESLSKKIDSKVTVSDDDVGMVYFLLERMGCWVLRGHGEGEALCSMMNRLDLGYAVVTEDSDSFPFGAKRVIRNWGSEKKESCMRIYDCQEIMKGLEIDLDKMIEICILCGNDFNNGVKLRGFAFQTSIEQIKEHNTIENIIENKLKENHTKKRKNPFQVPEEFDPYTPRREFYSYAKYPKLFDYIKIPKEFHWKPEEIIAYFKYNKLSTLIPSFVTCYEKATGRTLEPEKIEPKQFNTKLPLPPNLSHLESEQIDQLTIEEYEKYVNSFKNIQSSKSSSISSTASSSNKTHINMKEEILFTESNEDKKSTSSKSFIEDEEEEEFLIISKKI
jgi:5'-3' exonuclease